MIAQKNDKNASEQDEMVTDFGERKVNTQNFSKTVVLPKIALENCQCNGIEVKSVDVHLVQNNGEKFIKLVPICVTPDKEESKKNDGESQDDK